MPRYFFHVRANDGLVEDPERIECADEGSIREEAIEGARQLMAEHIRKGVDVSDWSYEIVDEHDRPVMTVAFSQAIRR